MRSWILRLPDLGEGLDDVELTCWLVGEGERLSVDQPVCEVFTNKVNVEVTSAYEGTVLALHASPGDRLRRGDPLATLQLAERRAGVVGVVPPPTGNERRVLLRPRRDG